MEPEDRRHFSAVLRKLDNVIPKRVTRHIYMSLRRPTASDKIEMFIEIE